MVRLSGRLLFFSLLAAGGGLGTGAGQSGRPAPATPLPAALDEARQLVLVVTADWATVRGSLRCFERPNAGMPWREIGSGLPVVVGRSGLAWGRGLHGELPGEGPVKQEGDGRSPAGIFRLSGAFGYDSPLPGLLLPYKQATEALECVDDPGSRYYNQLVDRSQVSDADWKSSEQMRRSDEAYRWGVLVDHNTPRTRVGDGSCIFLHIWGDPEKGTAGCTAMDASRMLGLMLWLDPRSRPVLVQLPEAEYSRLREPWRLP